ncbi:unnamed protein product [Brassica oleracea var. botrytis]|nr:unnamed protein product [Brassica napus]
MKLKRRRLVHGSVKMESFSLGTTSMCSEADRVETMALDLACGMSFLDGLEEKPEAVRRRSRRRDVIKETSETQQLKAVAEAKGCDSALGAFRELEKDPKHKSCFDVILYNTVISLCGRLALDAYDEMVNNNISPREDALYKRMYKGRSVELGVKDLSNVAKSLEHRPDEYTWNALLNRYEDVLQLFDMIRSESLCGVNGYLYNRALMSCQKLGCWEKAVKLLYEMEGSGLAVSTPSYNLVISACEKSRQSKVALRVYEHMVQRECKADTFTYLSLVRSCIWGSLWDEVKDILKKVEPDASLYNAAIHGMCLRREFKFAKELYVEMREMGLEPDGKTRAMMLQNLKRY